MVMSKLIGKSRKVDSGGVVNRKRYEEMSKDELLKLMDVLSRRRYYLEFLLNRKFGSE